MSEKFKFIVFAAILCCSLEGGFGQSSRSELPKVFLLDGEQTSRAASKSASDGAVKCGVGKIVKESDKALKVEIAPVTAKPIAPPSGDKHDYMSMAPYFWPDPKKKDGLPYIRRDGERNPEIKSIPDHDSLGRLVTTVEKLAQAYYLTRDEKYAAKATALMRTWFLAPATKMNPHLEYAQAVRGENTGRNFGIIETMGLPRLVDSIGLLAGAKSWTDADQNGMVKWFGEYLDWLLNSKLGKQEAATKNNHGTHYDEQVASFALFVGRRDLAKQVIETAKQKRIAAQIEPDGSQPLELARTQSWGYSTMNLSGFVNLARLGRHVDVDLWNYSTKDGRSIRRAFDYLAQFTAGGKKWEHQVLTPVEPERFNRLVRIARNEWKDAAFADLAAKSAAPDAATCTNVFY